MTGQTWATNILFQWASATDPKKRAANEQKAMDILTECEESRSVALRQVIDRFPETNLSHDALIELARQYMQEHRFGAAAALYRRLLTAPASDHTNERNDALQELAKAYESQHCFSAARRIRQRLGHAPESGDRPSFAHGATFGRLGEITLAKGEATLAIESGDLDAVEQLTFGVRENQSKPLTATVACYVLPTAKRRWASEVRFVPTWASCYADGLIVAGEQGIARLALDDGATEWSWVGPFPEGGTAADWLSEQASGSFAGFQLDGGNLFFVQERRRLFALDVDSGRVLWNRWAPRGQLQMGEFAPGYLVHDSIVTLQGDGKRWSLHAQDGTVLPGSEKRIAPRPAWERGPIAVPGGMCFTDGSRRVVMQSYSEEEPRWIYTIPGQTTLTGVCAAAPLGKTTNSCPDLDQPRLPAPVLVTRFGAALLGDACATRFEHPGCTRLGRRRLGGLLKLGQQDSGAFRGERNDPLGAHPWFLLSALASTSCRWVGACLSGS